MVVDLLWIINVRCCNTAKYCESAVLMRKWPKTVWQMRYSTLINKLERREKYLMW